MEQEQRRSRFGKKKKSFKANAVLGAIDVYGELVVYVLDFIQGFEKEISKMVQSFINQARVFAGFSLTVSRKTISVCDTYSTEQNAFVLE
jgi:hypothetical protein